MEMKKSALVMGKIKGAKKKEALERLWELGAVEDARLVTGEYDFIAKVGFDSFESFFDAYLQVKNVPEIQAQKVLIAPRKIAA